MADLVEMAKLIASIDKLRDRVPIWAVYDHPDDRPDQFVARMVLSLPEPKLSNIWLSCYDLDPLRLIIMQLGFKKMDRFEEDDPKLIETWI